MDVFLDDSTEGFAGRMEILEHSSGRRLRSEGERAWIKVLVWDQTGIVLVHKRLEGVKFVWPPVRDGVIMLFWSE